MILPSRRALIAFAGGMGLALLPVFLPPASWMAWAAFWILLALLFVVDAALSAPRSAWHCEIEMPELLPVGRFLPVRLTLEDATRRVPRVAVKVDVSENLETVPPATALIAAGRVVMPLPIRATHRGPARLETVWLRYEGPLGLATRIHSFPLDGHAVAAPDLLPVQTAAIEFLGSRSQTQGLKTERLVGEGSEFESLREFQKGHDHRAIDWKSSARHKRLLVRRFRAERNSQIILAVDEGRLMGEPLTDLARLDHAIHAALTLGFIALKSGDRVGFYAFDSQPRAFLPPQSGIQMFRSLVRAAGDLTYSHDETNFTLGLTNLSARLRRRSLIVVMTDFVDSITAELMIENLGRLADRHLTVFISLRDPDLSRLASARPDSLQTLNQAVASQALVRERALVMKRLRKAGIFCIDALPHQVNTELLNRYLTIKRRELI